MALGPSKVLDTKLIIRMVGDEGNIYEMEYILDNVQIEQSRERAPIYTLGVAEPMAFSAGKSTTTFSGSGHGGPIRRVISFVDKTFPSENFVLKIDNDLARFDELELD